jgi:hypothetical protein
MTDSHQDVETLISQVKCWLDNSHPAQSAEVDPGIVCQPILEVCNALVRQTCFVTGRTNRVKCGEIGVELIIELLRRGAPTKVLEAACKVLANITMFGINAQRCNMAGGLEVMLRIIEQQSCTNLLNYACQVLANACQDSNNVEKCLMIGTVDTLVQLLIRTTRTTSQVCLAGIGSNVRTDKMLSTACRVLLRITSNSTNLWLVGQAVTAVLQKHDASPNLLDIACRLMCRIVHASNAKYPTTVWAVIELVRQHKKHPAHLVARTCWLLGSLAKHSTYECCMAGVDALVDVLVCRVGQAAELVGNACWALDRIAKHDKHNIAMCGKAGAVEALLNALKHELDHPSANPSSLRQLSCERNKRNERNERNTRNTAGVNCFDNYAKYSLVNQTDLIRMVCTALCNMMRIDENQARCVDADGIQILVDLVKKQLNQPAVLRLACKALRNISHHKTAVSKCLVARSVDAMVEVVKHSTNQPAVIRAACQALINMTRNEPKQAKYGAGHIEELAETTQH